MIPVPSSLVPILQFLNIRDVFSNKEKEPVAGSQFPVPEYQLHIDICSFHIKSRKENPQKPTQLSSRSHPRHLEGKRTAQKTPS